MPRSRLPSLALALALLAAPASAHDFWVQPTRYWLPPGGVAPTSVQIGHADDRSVWPIATARVVQFRSLSAAGSIDHRAALRDGARSTPLRFDAPGTHVLVFENTPIESVLPGLRFTDYLQKEGLTPALRLRDATRRTDAPGRELYSRRAKALLQVGPRGRPQPHVTTPIGLTLEIVPEKDPYALKAGEALPVRVLYQGRPLPGALVKLTDLRDDAEPLQALRTDAAGRAVFRPRLTGEWLLNVVWTRPLVGDRRAEFDTVFSSLTFGYPAGGDPERPKR